APHLHLCTALIVHRCTPASPSQSVQMCSLAYLHGWSAVAMPRWLLLTAFNGRERVPDRKIRVSFAVFLRFGAFLHEPLARFLTPKAPREGSHAPHKVCPAGVGAIFLAVERRTLKANGIARPFTSPVGNTGGLRGGGHGFWSCDKAHTLELAGCCLPPSL